MVVLLPSATNKTVAPAPTAPTVSAPVPSHQPRPRRPAKARDDHHRAHRGSAAVHQGQRAVDKAHQNRRQPSTAAPPRRSAPACLAWGAGGRAAGPSGARRRGRRRTARCRRHRAGGPGPPCIRQAAVLGNRAGGQARPSSPSQRTRRRRIDHVAPRRPRRERQCVGRGSVIPALRAACRIRSRAGSSPRRTAPTGQRCPSCSRPSSAIPTGSAQARSPADLADRGASWSQVIVSRVLSSRAVVPRESRQSFL